MFSQNEAHWVASSTAPLQSEFESRRHKRQREEDGSPEYFTTKNKLLQLKDHLIHLMVHYLMMMTTLLPQKEDMVKDQLETNLTGKKLVPRNSELL